MEKLKLLRIGSIKVDKEIYPRMHTDFVTIARYINALKSGAVFPPITVAKLGKEYFLIDGMHRIEANKANKQTHIQAEILDLPDKKQIYLEAVKRNISHGKQFTTQEVTQIMITLEDWNLSEQQISEIIRIPATSIKPFIASRMTRITETQEQIALKNPLRHLAGGFMSQDMEEEQKDMRGTSQVDLFDDMISLFENDWIDKENPLIQSRIRKLIKLLDVFSGVKIQEISKTK